MTKDKFTKNVAVSLIILVFVATIGFAAYTYVRNKDNIIPAKYKKQIAYVVYWPEDASSSPQKSTIKYDSKTGVLSYVDYYNSKRIVINQQATPSVFNDFSNYYSTMINHLNNYQTISTQIGNVYLTLPPNTDNSNSAVSNNHGTLLFATSRTQMSANNWLRLFNGLKVILN